MLTLDELREGKPEELAVPLAQAVAGIIGTVRRALEAVPQDASRDQDACAALAVAEVLAGLLVDGCRALDEIADDTTLNEIANARTNQDEQAVSLDQL